MSTSQVTSKIIKVYLGGFHKYVREAYRTHGFYSPWIIDENEIDQLVDPTINFFLKQRSNIFLLDPAPHHQINKHFDRETFLQLFDDLAIEFGYYLNTQSIGVRNHYIVKREDNINAFFKMVDYETYNDIVLHSTKLEEGAFGLRGRFEVI